MIPQQVETELTMMPENVKKELDAIFATAKSQELQRLKDNLGSLDGGWPTHCVYGLLTGSCYSARAVELAKLCSTESIDPVLAKTRFLTPLEKYILHPRGESIVFEYITNTLCVPQ